MQQQELPDIPRSESAELDSDFEVESLPKHLMRLRFSDEVVQNKYQEFLKRRIEKTKYVNSFFMLNLIAVLSLSRFLFYYNESPLEIARTGTTLLWWSHGVSGVGAVFVILFDLLQVEAVEEHVQYWLPDIFELRGNLVLVALLCIHTGFGVHNIVRSLGGECMDDIPLLHCNPNPGAPPVFQYLSYIMLVLYGYIACKGLVGYYSQLIMWATTSFLFVYVAYIEDSYIALSILISLVVMVVPYVINYQDMITFEYHAALEKAIAIHIKQVHVQTEKEKTQLQLVLANVAHDLKTPLQAFSAGMNAMQDEISDEKKSALASLSASLLSTLADMKAAYAFMMMQINRALDVSKSSNGVNLLPRPESFVLGNIVSWAVNIMRTVQTKVVLNLDYDPNTLLDTPISTDKVWLQENLLCMLSNAVKYSPENTHVTLRVQLLRSEATGNSAQLLIQVRDEGIGVPAGCVENMFKPFVQAQRHVGGTGLGLYSLALRVQALGGTFGFTSNSPDPGSTFYFSFPFYPGTPYISDLPKMLSSLSYVSFGHTPESPRHGNDREASFTSSNSEIISPISVLIVDDSLTTLKLLGRGIKAAGMSVETATDGFAALNKMKEKLYTAVIMDIQMPIMDGVESVKQLRAEERRLRLNAGPLHKAPDLIRHQYVIGASACTLDETRQSALAAGMDVFLQKPVALKDVIELIRLGFQPQYPYSSDEFSTVGLELSLEERYST